MSRVWTTGLLVLAFALAACGSDGDTGASGGSSGSTGGEQLLGFINPIGAQPILAMVGKTLEQQGGKYGYKVDALDSALKSDQEAANINQLIAKQAKVIVAWLLSEGSGVQLLNRATAAGAKIIGFGRFPTRKPPADMGPFVSSVEQGSAFEGARQLADFVGRKLGGKGNVIGMTTCTGSPAVNLIVNNYKKFLLAKYPDITWLDTVCNQSDDIKGGQQVTEQALTKHKNDIQAVMAYNDTSAIGAGNALRTAGIKSGIVVGQNGGPDAVAAVKNGTESASVDTEPVKTAAMILEAAKKVSAGEPLPKIIVAPVSIITPDNVARHKDWDSQLNELKAGKLDIPPLQ